MGKAHRLMTLGGSVLVSVSAVAVLLGAPTTPSTLPPLTVLEPGGFRDINQTLPVNVVFVGYEEGSGAQQIDPARVHAFLPQSYKPTLRLPRFYGIEKFIGLTFTYQYNILFADSTFEDAFFGWAARVGVTEGRTFYQTLYNTETPRTQTIPDTILRISAPAAEEWLAEHAPSMLGVDTTRYTVFFINWWGRSDFQYHVYKKGDDFEPDTGLASAGFHENALIAYGGTPTTSGHVVRRVWFHDLSAGPEWETTNWSLTIADLDGNGAMDYRMPPIWEYGNTDPRLFRPFDDLTGDLAVLVRFVALNLLFTTSPVYDPAISPPKLPSSIVLDVNLHDGVPGFDARTILNTNHLVREVAALQPHNTFSAIVTDRSLSGQAARVYQCFAQFLQSFGRTGSCYGERLFGSGFGDLFLYHTDHLLEELAGDADYSLPIFTYYVPPEDFAGLGLADDNYMDGTQSFVYTFSTPAITRFGFGLTYIMLHETGHHLGMSHPVDGYDYEFDFHYFPRDDVYFAWVGAESPTIMGNLFLGTGFSQFERDNMNRYLVASYINQANAVLALIENSAQAGQVTEDVSEADAVAANALSEYAAMSYAASAGHAKQAYEHVLAAAAAIHVPVEPEAWQADYKAAGVDFKFMDMVLHRGAGLTAACTRLGQNC